ncbi:MAG: tRNA preQ1(34) S-adenosylmethionine ribosyltransferase-isomerase QueA [Fimbriimonadaceae bacterium]|nr:tRNA preQ1(34) S-adenosylmethionine ribosyltransferase-isomerase QueA [Fimbriimonadaceae bacterium]
MNLADFDYHLPEELIAQRPIEPRDASRLLHLDRRTGAVSHRSFRDCLEILQPGDLLVMNDTMVSAVRIFGRRPTGARVEALIHREVEGTDEVEALTRPAKKLRPGETIEFEGGLAGEVTADLGEGRKRLRLSASRPWRQVLKEIGQAPLPGYIHEPLADRGRYQTVYAENPGSSAAPTAGLHFTADLLARLAEKGVETARVTLDVSTDTFRPITAENPADHRMHGETCRLPTETAEAVARCRGRVIAVGTTAVRTLESFAVGPRRLEPGEQLSRLYIRPGFEYRVVDGMFTNFHMPRTTMLLMLSALAGRERVMEAYR